MTNRPAAKDKPRLPPGQTLVTAFPVLSYGPTPRFNPAKWDFRVMGLVERALRLTWEEFKALPAISQVADFHCVTSWSRYDNQWDGIPTRFLAEQAAVKREAKFVFILCDGGYTANLPLDEFLDQDAMLRCATTAKPSNPIMAIRCDWSCPSSTRGRAPNGYGQSNSPPTIDAASGKSSCHHDAVVT